MAIVFDVHMEELEVVVVHAHRSARLYIFRIKRGSLPFQRHHDAGCGLREFAKRNQLIDPAAHGARTGKYVAAICGLTHPARRDAASLSKLKQQIRMTLALLIGHLFTDQIFKHVVPCV